MDLINWDLYYGKHCARYYGWLPASKNFKAKVGNKKLKYLTLCDVTALDIFMLEKEGVLTRDENKYLSDVIICEMKEGLIQEIFEVVRPPLKEAIIPGKIEKLLIFEDDADTVGVDPDTDVRSKKVRDKLNLKKRSKKLQSAFPFDIINFDPFGNIFRTQSELYRGFKRIFELQDEIDTFLLFITSSISIEEVSKLFKDDFDNNVKKHPSIKEIVEANAELNNYDGLEDYKKASIGLSKTLINKIALEYGWVADHKGIYVYENDKRNHLVSAVIEVSKNQHKSNHGWYVSDVENILQNMPVFFSFEESTNNQAVKNHIKKVVKHREAIQKDLK